MWQKQTATALVALLLAGCSTAQPTSPRPVQTPEQVTSQAPPQPVTQPAPTAGAPSVPAAPPAQLPAAPTAQLDKAAAALPLWGEPGLRLVDDHKEQISYSYQPVAMQGRQIQPVQVLYARAQYLALENGAVYQYGVTDRGGWAPLPSPQLLYRLPLKEGDTWQQAYDSASSETHRVLGFEELDTPAGRRVAVRIQVERKDGAVDHSEWWVPGYGLVRLDYGGGRMRAAAAEERKPAEAAPAVGRPEPGAQVLLWSSTERYRITSLDGNTEYFRIDDSYWKSSYRWVQAGDIDLLLHATSPSANQTYYFTAYRLSLSNRRQEPVPFVRADGSRSESQSSDLMEWTPSGRATFHKENGYPEWWLTYQYDPASGTLREVPELTRRVVATSAEDLIRRLVSIEYLPHNDFLTMWADPKLGQQYLDELKQQGVTPSYPSWHEEAVPGQPDTFEAEYGLMARFRVQQVGGEYKIVAWEWAK